MAVFITASVARMSVAISGRCWSGPGFRGAHCASNFPDVPTTEEATGHKWHKGVWRGFDMIYLDLADFAEFVKADNEDNGKALKSLGLAT
jgi:hypothetical protein